MQAGQRGHQQRFEYLGGNDCIQGAEAGHRAKSEAELSTDCQA
jgi:hypothetical protein